MFSLLCSCVILNFAEKNRDLAEIKPKSFREMSQKSAGIVPGVIRQNPACVTVDDPGVFLSDRQQDLVNALKIASISERSFESVLLNVSG